MTGRHRILPEPTLVNPYHGVGSWNPKVLGLAWWRLSNRPRKFKGLVEGWRSGLDPLSYPESLSCNSRRTPSASGSCRS